MLNLRIPDIFRRTRTIVVEAYRGASRMGKGKKLKANEVTADFQKFENFFFQDSHVFGIITCIADSMSEAGLTFVHQDRDLADQANSVVSEYEMDTMVSELTLTDMVFGNSFTVLDPDHPEFDFLEQLSPKSVSVNKDDKTGRLNGWKFREGGLEAELTREPLLHIPINCSDEFYADVQPSTRAYLRITIRNSTGFDRGGFVTINGSDGLSNELTERFYMYIRAGQEQIHYSSQRYATLSGAAVKAFQTEGWAGCTIRAEETTYSVAGRSINDYGVRGRAIRNINFDTQAKVDAYASQLVRMYHAPLVHVDAAIKPEFANPDELVGKTVRLYDNFLGDFADFVCTNQRYYFEGPAVKEEFSAMRYNYDWDYSS